MSAEEYDEYVGRQKVLYDVEDQSLKQQLETLNRTYEELLKNYEAEKMSHNQDNLYNETKLAEAIKDKSSAEKQSDEILNYYEKKMEEMKYSIFEIPCKRLYGLAFRWQEPSNNVFLAIDNETKEFEMLTKDEIEGKVPMVKGRPVFRHWWKTIVCDVKSGSGFENGS